MKDSSKRLEGKTIKTIERCKWDDGHPNWIAIKITFTDNTKIKIRGYSNCCVYIEDDYEE